MLRSGPAPPVEFCRKLFEARFPHRAVAHHPFVQFAERLRPERVEPPTALRTDGHELSVLHDGELPRDTGLSDVDDADQLAHRALTIPQRLDEAASGGVRQDLEGVGHAHTLLLRHMSCQRYISPRISAGRPHRGTPPARRGPAS